MSIWMNMGRIGCTKVVYDGFVLSDVFEVRDVAAPWLPPIEASTLEISDHPGAWYVTRNIRTRDIILTLALDAQSRCSMDIRHAWREFSPKLAKNKPCKLELGDDGYVWAMLTGETPITNEAYKGVIDVTFTCFDPYYYGEVHTVDLTAGSNNIYIHGGCSAYPQFEVTGVSGTCTIMNGRTAEQLRVTGLTSTTTLYAYMEDCYCAVNGAYREADPQVSDFWPLEPGDNVINLSAGHGTLTYQERYL